MEQVSRNTRTRLASAMDMNDDSFARMVAEEVKNKLSPLHKKVLLQPENWDRWKRALIALSDHLQAQIEDAEDDAVADVGRYSSMGGRGKKLSSETRTYYENKINKIKRFKFHVDKRLDEVSLMIDTGQSIQNDGWDKVEFYRRAIIAHRNLMREYDLEDTAIDRALWETLDDKWTFDDINTDNL